MKPKKIIFISALSAMLLCACSSDKAVSETAKLYNIGAIIPITGDNKDIGISIKQGAMLAIDEINENGGINNGEEYRINLVVANDESKSQYADYAYESLKKDGTNAVIGLIDNEECDMLSKKFVKDEVVALSTSQNASNAEYDNVFTLCNSDKKTAKELAKFIYEKKSCKNVGIIYSNTDDYTSISEAFTSAFEKNEGEILFNSCCYEEDMKTSCMDKIIETLGENKPDAILILANPKETASICNKLKRANIDSCIVASKSSYGIIEAIDDNTIIEGVNLYVDYYKESEEKRVKKFTEKYKEKYRVYPNNYAAYAYDSIYMIVNTIKNSGEKDINKVSIAEKIVDLKYDGVTGTEMSFDENGYVSKEDIFIYVKNAQYVEIE